MMNKSKVSRGFGLVELMVALALGVLLLGGLIQVFIGIRTSFRLQQNLSFVQETGRFAIEMMKPDVRDAGKLDFCVADLRVQNLLNTVGTGYVAELFDPQIPIVGWEFDGTAAGDTYNLPSSIATANDGSNWDSTNGTTLPAIVANNALPGSDVLLVKSADAVESLTACNDNVSTSESLNINFAVGGNACTGGQPADASITQSEMSVLLPRSSVILVTDCSSGGDLFQRANNPTNDTLSRSCGSGDPGNVCAGRSWSAAYGDTMQVFRTSATVFFVGLGVSGEPSLFRLDLGSGGAASAPVELVEGVEAMQLRFGVLDAFGNITYQEVDQVANPLNVMSIAISMIVRSGDLADSTVESGTFDLEGVTTRAPGDRRIRKVFSTTVAIRNRINVL